MYLPIVPASNDKSTVVMYRMWPSLRCNPPSDTDHHDAVPGTGSRFSNFRRVGATVPGAQPPAQVDIVPFIAVVRKMWPGQQVGPWLGHVALATELYDFSVGAVTFSGPPTVDPRLKKERRWPRQE